MKIIVLSKTDYQEKDVLISAISDEKFISFKVRGGQSPTSAFMWLNNPLTIADVEFIENPRYIHKILKNAKLLYSPLSQGGSYNNLLAISFVSEVTNKVLSDDAKHLMFKEIEDFFEGNKGNEDYLLSEISFLSHAANYAGYGINVDECVFCQTKQDIVGFSFTEGGFVCRKCFNKEMEIDFTGKQMLLLRYLVKNKNYRKFIEDGANEKASLDDKRLLLSKFSDFTDNAIGVHLNSVDLILKNK